MVTNLWYYFLIGLSILNLYKENNNGKEYNTSFSSVRLLSDFQSEIGCSGGFDETCIITEFVQQNANWLLTLSVPAGDWKILIKDGANTYGQNGVLNAPAISFVVKSKAEVNFVYNPINHKLSIQSQSLESRSSMPPVAEILELTDTLIYDPNTNMVANPADSIRYTMILKNESGQSLIPTNLTRTGDPNTTYDPNSLKASPLAFNDTFPYDVHPKMVMAGLGLLANDYDLNDPLPNPPFNANLTVVRVNSMPLGGAIPTMGGGSVTVMSDGSFSYDSTNTNGATTDFFQYTVLDQDGFYDSAFVLIQFNEPPAIASNIPATDTICAFEQRDTFLMTSAFSISDDGTVIASAKVEICTNYLATEDTLIPGSLPGGITTAWTDGSGTLMLMGNASLADYETAIEGIQYLNQADAPNTSIREICISVYDGITNSNQVTRLLKVKPVNDCPTAVRDTVSILENNDLTMFNVLANDTDLENNMLSLTKINGGMSLSMVNISGGTINSLATNGILNFSHTTGFTGLDSLSAGEMFFTRFEYSMSDGSCEDSDSVIIKITGLNDAPLIASNLFATDTICAFEMQDTFLVTTAFTLLDDEDNTDSATISICTNYLNSEDTLLTGALPGGIMTAWNDATGTLKLYGSTTKANYVTAIKAFQYLNSSNTPNTNTRRICITVHDGDLLSNQVTRELKVKPVNDCPVAVRDTLLVTENGSNMPGNVLTNDTDPENNALTVTMVNASSANSNVVINGGTINMATAGTVSFTHTTGAMGLDTLNLNQMFFARAQYTNNDGLCTDNDSVIIKITGINDTPFADSNKYALAQTSTLTIVAPGILSDDDDIDNGSVITVGEVNGSAANVGVLVTLPSGADLTVQSNGGFTYNPKCLVAGLDSFTYAAKDEHNALSITVKVYLQVSQTMWFVHTGTNGTGSYNSPFNTFASVESQSQPGDYIFLFPGNYTQNLLLKNNQKLIGAIEDWLCPSGSTIRMATPSDITNFQGELSLAMNDTVKGIGFNSISTSPLLGLESRSSTGSIFIKDNNVSVGDLFMSNNRMIIANTARCGFVLKNGGTLNVTFNSISIAGTGQTAIDLNSCNGNMMILGGTISNFGDTMVNIKGGQISATFNNSISQSDNFPLLTVTDHSVGTLTFQTGTISATNGTGLQFNNADGSYNFNGTTILGGGDAGVDILNGSSGLFSFSPSTSITNPSGTAFNVGGASTASITYSGNISDNTGFAIDIDDHDANNITFQTGTINSTGSGIRVQNCSGGIKTFANTSKSLNTGANNAVILSSNLGATIDFTNGGLDIDCTLGTGFGATGGGTISVQGAGNSITTTTGSALNVANTTIGNSNLTFQSIASNGSASGIVLNTTGNAGGLAVTGTGSTNSGGIIQNCTGIGVSLTSTINTSLSWMKIDNCISNGIFCDEVTSFSFSNCIIRDNGILNTANQAGILFKEIYGTCTMTNDSLSLNAGDNLRYEPASGTLTNLTITNTGFHNNGATGGANGFAYVSTGTATSNITISNSRFLDNFASGFLTTVGGSSLNVTIANSQFSDNNIGVDLGNGPNSDVDFNVSACLLLRQTSNAFNIVSDANSTNAASYRASITNNTIGDNNTDSGSQNTYGIAVDLRGDVQAVMNITGNIIRHTDQEGIFIQSRLENALSAGDPSYALTLRNNTVANIDDNSAFPFVTLYGVRIESRNNTQLCLDIQDNSSTSVGGLEHFRVRQRDASIFRLERFGGVGTDENAVAGFIVGQNVIGSTASATKSTTYTGVLDNFCSNY